MQDDHLHRILTGLIGTRSRETTALLAVIAELLVDDPAPRRRCRREVAERGEHLPPGIGALSQASIYRAVRRTDEFGDVYYLVVGMELEGGHELTVAVLHRSQHRGRALSAMQPLPRTRSTRGSRG